MAEQQDFDGMNRRSSIGELPPTELVFGHTAAMSEIRQAVLNATSANVPVLIRGESGTGKEVLARMIHSCSPRKSGRFVKVHCPAIPSALLESELFGFEVGAFTGAIRSKPGRVEAAQGGTLFLDEIAEMDSSLQAKLLHFLQDGWISRVGGEEERQVDPRVICATHRALEDEIAAGRFRQDLFYRINVVSIYLPPLRERREDVVELTQYFLEVCSSRYNRIPSPLSTNTLELLQAYDWPGNLRELENLINRYAVIGSEEVIRRELLNRIPSTLIQGSPSQQAIPLQKIARQAAREAERRVLLQVLEATHGSRKEAARALNISYRGLLYKLKNVGIPPKRTAWSPNAYKVVHPN